MNEGINYQSINQLLINKSIHPPITTVIDQLFNNALINQIIVVNYCIMYINIKLIHKK